MGYKMDRQEKILTSKTELDSSEINAVLLEAFNKVAGGFAVFGPNNEVLLSSDQNEHYFGTFNNILRDGGSYQDAIFACTMAVAPKMSVEDAKAFSEKITAELLRGEAVELLSEKGGIFQVTEIPLSQGRRLSISADITVLRQRERELKKARREAETANEAKSAFLANISHEIRTPLNGMLGITHQLASSDLTPAQRDQIEIIQESGKTLLALLNDVLDLSKIEAGKFDITPVDNDLYQLMQRQSRLWMPRAQEKGLTLVLDIECEVKGLLHFDPVRVRQCISNLVSNAIKFTPHGSVTISVRATKGEDGLYDVCLAVKDTGIGISKAAQEQLFAPFSQGGASITREYGGTGLGLSISRKLARLMGGDVTVTSTEGEGSTFTFTFRAQAAGAQKDAKSSDARESNPEGLAALLARGVKVLVVDDHPLNRKVARLFLEPLKMTTFEAENGEEALALLDKEQFDLVLLDMHMPVMDGRETLAHIRAEGSPHRDLSVIVLSADSLGPLNNQYLEMGANGSITKPIDHRALVSEILRITEEKYGVAPEPAEAMPFL